TSYGDWSSDRVLFRSFVSLETPNLLGMPDEEQDSHRRHGANRRNHIHQPRPMKIGHQELRNCEEHPGNEHSRPNFKHPAESSKGDRKSTRLNSSHRTI